MAPSEVNVDPSFEKGVIFHSNNNRLKTCSLFNGILKHTICATMVGFFLLLFTCILMTTEFSKIFDCAYTK